MEITNPDGTSVRAVRRFAATPQRMWQAFTNPADMARWMWGSLTKNCVAEADLRVGGRYSVYTDSEATKDGWPTNRVGRRGIYVEVVPGERIVYTLQWDAPVGYNQKGDLVTDEVFVVSFTADDGGTIVEVDHLGIPDDGVSAAGHRLGLADELETVASLVDS